MKLRTAVYARMLAPCPHCGEPAEVLRGGAVKGCYHADEHASKGENGAPVVMFTADGDGE